jgi:hypothetical protein
MICRGNFVGEMRTQRDHVLTTIDRENVQAFLVDLYTIFFSCYAPPESLGVQLVREKRTPQQVSLCFPHNIDTHPLRCPPANTTLRTAR